MSAIRSTVALGPVVPVVPARDVEQAIAFYRDRLGFEPVFRAGKPAEYAGVRRDRAEIHFFRCDEPGITEWICFRVGVNAIDDLYAHCRGEGIVHPDGGLNIKPWGSREFTVIDQDGVALTFFQT